MMAKKRILVELAEKIHRIECAIPSAYGSPRFATLLGELIDIHQLLQSGKLEAQIRREGAREIKVTLDGGESGRTAACGVNGCRQIMHSQIEFDAHVRRSHPHGCRRNCDSYACSFGCRLV